MSIPRINLVVIGHKDHGKSTLIGRMLYDSKAIPELKLQEIKKELSADNREFEFAFILDSLEEERKGGLTIDIMQMPFKSKKYQYSIIDSPGHREFIKKMLTGASQADAAILVLSAKEGIEDQTKQHALLAKILGIKQIVVALNKMDYVGYRKDRFKELSEDIDSILRSMNYSNVKIIPISAMQGDNVIKESTNMEWYKGKTLIDTLDDLAKPVDFSLKRPLRAVVQDVYEVQGQKLIVCKIESGKLEQGKRVLCLPNGDGGMVETIESLDGNRKEAIPGDSVGLRINDLKNVKRGDVLCYSDNPATVAELFESELILFSNIDVRKGSGVTIKVGTSERECRVEEIIEKIDPINLVVEEKNPESLANGDVGIVLFRSSDPICIELYSEIPQLGRFVVVDKKGTAAAGIVLEIKSPDVGCKE